MLSYLQKKPNLRQFQLMKDWDEVLSSPENDYAKVRYVSKAITFDFNHISRKRAKADLLAFLRYDYKKTLIRTRYLYIDRLFSLENFPGGDLDWAFFEPILLCFPCLEFLGRITHADLFMASQKGRNTSGILRSMLEQMGSGYRENAEKLVDWYRHALSHELRPDGVWECNLNTGDKYGAPSLENGKLCLNIPHFIDSCIVEVEKICDALASSDGEIIMNNFDAYLQKRI